MSAVKIGDSKIAANAAIQTTRCPVPEKAGCIGGGRNFMSCDSKIVSLNCHDFT